MAENKFTSLDTCAAELGISTGYMRSLFRRTKFWPVFRLNQVAFYMRYDFDAWCSACWRDGRHINHAGGIRLDYVYSR